MTTARKKKRGGNSSSAPKSGKDARDIELEAAMEFESQPAKAKGNNSESKVDTSEDAALARAMALSDPEDSGNDQALGSGDEDFTQDKELNDETSASDTPTGSDSDEKPKKKKQKHKQGKTAIKKESAAAAEEGEDGDGSTVTWTIERVRNLFASWKAVKKKFKSHFNWNHVLELMQKNDSDLPETLTREKCRSKYNTCIGKYNEIRDLAKKTGAAKKQAWKHWAVVDQYMVKEPEVADPTLARAGLGTKSKEAKRRQRRRQL